MEWSEYTTTLEHKRYGQNFSIVYTIARKSFSVAVYFCRALLIVSLALIDDIRLPISLLPQNHPNRMITNITHNFEKKDPIGRINDKGRIEGLFDHVKSLKTLISKNKGGIFS